MQAEAGSLVCQVDLPLSPLASGAAVNPAFSTLFAEELGLVMEVAPEHEAEALTAYLKAGLPASIIGTVSADMGVEIQVAGRAAVSGVMAPPALGRFCRCGCMWHSFQTHTPAAIGFRPDDRGWCRDDA